MKMESEDPDIEGYLRRHTVGELKPLSGLVVLAEPDPAWPEVFVREAENIQVALGNRVLRIEHVGSTSVPELPAKPVIDIVLVVADSADEGDYGAALEKAGYRLRIREPGWHEHRMFRDPESRVNLHVFSVGCPEVDRMLAFRDRLRSNAADRESYARAKRDLARREWKYTQNYADAKTSVIEEIMSRARQEASGEGGARFELLEHPADIGFRARGETLEDLFGNCGRALVSIILDPSAIQPLQSIEIRATGIDLESLLVNWLNEVLYHVDGGRLALADFAVARAGDGLVECVAKGERRDRERHPARVDVKAVTYHQLRIERTADGWLADVYVDT